MTITTRIEAWELAAPFTITGYTFHHSDVLFVEVLAQGKRGIGEGAGVYYLNDTVERGKAQIEALAATLRQAQGDTGAPSREELIELLPAGGARNAVDCALWDLESKLQNRPAWQIAGLSEPRPVLTTYTVSADEPQIMADRARKFDKARAIKLKLTGSDDDAERVRAVRAARPDVWLGVDGNQGFDRGSLEALLPVLVDANVQLLEQPFPRDRDADLNGLGSPIPVAADESAQDLDDVERLAGCVDVINIKLDKCGGLTRGFAMAARARELGLETMVGCMIGTSVSVAPGLLLGQVCKIVDLDAPIHLKHDRAPSVVYDDAGCVFTPPDVWGPSPSN
ncbi:MAG: dipeptide epimerase [Candidatus Eremiobacteraeota bacterium]|nr:dipeptide epimerase [Candidatus Eremiobacteraeota bacterium]